MPALLGALLATAIVVFALAEPVRATGPSSDQADAAIGRVRDLLRSRGRPADGPMIAALVRPDAPPDDPNHAWMVVSDDGIWVVWGGAFGPLGPDEARTILRACVCEVAPPAPTGLSNRAPPRSI